MFSLLKSIKYNRGVWKSWVLLWAPTYFPLAFPTLRVFNLVVQWMPCVHSLLCPFYFPCVLLLHLVPCVPPYVTPKVKSIWILATLEYLGNLGQENIWSWDFETSLRLPIPYHHPEVPVIFAVPSFSLWHRPFPMLSMIHFPVTILYTCVPCVY